MMRSSARIKFCFVQKYQREAKYWMILSRTELSLSTFALSISF